MERPEIKLVSVQGNSATLNNLTANSQEEEAREHSIAQDDDNSECRDSGLRCPPLLCEHQATSLLSTRRQKEGNLSRAKQASQKGGPSYGLTGKKRGWGTEVEVKSVQ